MATLLSELPISEVIEKSEEKHGSETHVVIECVSKENISESYSVEETEDMVYWWVEFENQVQTFETFAEVEKFLLEDAVSSGSKWIDSMKEKQNNGV